MEASQGYATGGFWQNQSEALNILNPLLELAAPSKEALVQLSTIPPFSNSNSSPGDSHVAFVFLQVASKHMPVVATEAIGSVHLNGVKHLADVVSEVRNISFFVLRIHILAFLCIIYDFFVFGSSWEKQPRFVNRVPSYPNQGFCQCFPPCTIDQFRP